MKMLSTLILTAGLSGVAAAQCGSIVYGPQFGGNVVSPAPTVMYSSAPTVTYSSAPMVTYSQPIMMPGTVIQSGFPQGTIPQGTVVQSTAPMAMPNAVQTGTPTTQGTLTQAGNTVPNTALGTTSGTVTQANNTVPQTTTPQTGNVVQANNPTQLGNVVPNTVVQSGAFTPNTNVNPAILGGTVSGLPVQQAGGAVYSQPFSSYSQVQPLGGFPTNSYTTGNTIVGGSYMAPQNFNQPLNYSNTFGQQQFLPTTPMVYPQPLNQTFGQAGFPVQQGQLGNRNSGLFGAQNGMIGNIIGLPMQAGRGVVRTVGGVFRR